MKAEGAPVDQPSTTSLGPAVAGTSSGRFRRTALPATAGQLHHFYLRDRARPGKHARRGSGGGLP